MNSSTAIVSYFGAPTINRFIKHYFETYGKTEDTQNELMAYATIDRDEFLNMLCDFLDKE